MRFVVLLFVATTLIPSARAQSYGATFVFEYAVRNAQGTVDQIAAQVLDRAKTSGFTVLAESTPGVPAACGYESRVLSLYDATYASALAAAQAGTAAFAAVDRINIFADEEGVHVAYVNPLGINRTVLLDDTGFTTTSRSHRDKLRQVITSSATGDPSDRGFGPERDQGYIGRTMGVMAGGPFNEKVQILSAAAGADLGTVLAKLREALSRPGPEWGIKIVYDQAMPGGKTHVLGLSGRAMESKSFEIVRSGSDNARNDLTCPGIAHAAAYPLELVVIERNGGVDVVLVDAMYRMKMYFEDAGKWAFMKNMGMPGSIADEIRTAVRAALATQ